MLNDWSGPITQQGWWDSTHRIGRWRHPLEVGYGTACVLRRRNKLQYRYFQILILYKFKIATGHREFHNQKTLKDNIVRISGEKNIRYRYDKCIYVCMCVILSVYCFKNVCNNVWDVNLNICMYVCITSILFQQIFNTDFFGFYSNSLKMIFIYVTMYRICSIAFCLFSFCN